MQILIWSFNITDKDEHERGAAAHFRAAVPV